MQIWVSSPGLLQARLYKSRQKQHGNRTSHSDWNGALQYHIEVVFVRLIGLVTPKSTLQLFDRNPETRARTTLAQNPTTLAVPPFPLVIAKTRLLPGGLDVTRVVRVVRRPNVYAGQLAVVKPSEANRLATCPRINLILRQSAARALTYQAAASLACGKGYAACCIACGSDASDRWW